MTTGANSERPEIKIFLSSPGDVNEERVLADRVMRRLAERYAAVAVLKPIVWEHEPLLATSTFQDQIEKPSATDIVVCVLWSRLGTRLPPHIQREDGSRYESGTEYEFEDAWKAMKENGRPDLLVYRKMSEPLISLSDDEVVEERLRQKRALDGFIQKWFHDQDGSLLAAFHAFRNSAEFEETFEVHLDKLVQRRLEELGVDPNAAPSAETGQETDPDWTGSPFRGLETFEFEHAPIFYGRTHAVSGVLDALRKQANDGQAFVLVLGRSGGGKSSLVRAGVMPLLVEPGVVEGVGLWRRVIFRPATAAGDIFEAFAAALIAEGALPEMASDGATTSELAAILRDNPQGAAPLIKGALAQAAQRASVEAVEAAIKAGAGRDDAERAQMRKAALDRPPQARLALLVDQMEELFTDAAMDAATRDAFVEAVAALARSGRVFVVATLRSDFYHRSMEIPALGALKGAAGQFDLAPPTAAEIGQIIRGPAHRAGLRFEQHPDTDAKLDDALRDIAASEPDSLPLLEFTLEELYQARSPEGVLTWSAYEALGGVAGALGRRAEEVFGELDADARGALPAVMRQIVHVGLGQDQAPTKRPARLDRFAEGGPARRLIDAFVAARLFVVGKADDDAVVATLAHEALLGSWPRLATWLDDDRELLRIRARVAFAAERWEEGGRDAQLLLPAGKPLEEAALIADEQGFELSEAEDALIRQSRARAKRGARLKRMAVAALVALTVAASGAAWYADGQRKEAAQSAREATIARTAAETAQSRAEASAEEARAARIDAEANADAAEAARIEAETAKSLAEASEAVATDRLNALFLEQGNKALAEGRVEDAALILGAAHAGAPSDRTGALFSLATDLASVRGPSVLAHADPVSAMAAGPGGLVATASEAGEIAVRDMETGALLARRQGPDAAVHALAFSPDGAVLAAAGDAGSITLWRFAEDEAQTLRNHERPITRLVFSQDGTRFASTSYDGSTQVWTVEDAGPIAMFWENYGAPLAGNFIEGGEAFVTINEQGGAAVWDVATWEETRRLADGDGAALDAAVIEDAGRVLVAYASGGLVGISLSEGHEDFWRIDGLFREIRPLERGRVLARTKDGAMLLDAATGETISRFDGGEGGLTVAAASPDGGLAATLDRDGRVAIADGRSGRVLAQLTGHEAPGSGMVFSPDGTRLATVADDGSMNFLDLAALQPCRPSDVDDRAVALSPDGATLAAGGSDGRVRLVDAATCGALRTAIVDPGGDWVQRIAFSKDGAVAAAVSGAQVALIDVESGEVLWRRAAPDGRFMTSVSWTIEDDAVLVGDRALRPVRNEGGWRKFAREGGSTLMQSGEPRIAVAEMATHPAGRYAMTTGRFGLHLWWLDSGDRRHRIVGQKMRSYAIWPGGARIGVGYTDGTIGVLRHTSSELISFKAFDAPVSALAIDEEGRRFAAGSSEGEASVWDAKTGDLIGRIGSHDAAVADIAFAPGTSFLISAAEDGGVTLWDAEAGGAVARYDGGPGARPEIAVAADGSQFAVANGSGPARLWSLPKAGGGAEDVVAAIESATPLSFADDAPAPIGRWRTLAYETLLESLEADARLSMADRRAIERGRRAAARGDALAAERAWSGVDAELPPAYAVAAEANRAVLNGLAKVLRGHEERVEDIAFSPNSDYLASFDWSGRLVVWNADDWSERFRLVIGDGGDIEISPDGARILVENSDEGISVIDAVAGEVLVSLAGGNSGKWSTDGARVAVSPRLGPPLIYDAESGALIAKFAGFDPLSRAYALSPDFGTLAAPGDAGIELIDVASREVAATIAPPTPGAAPIRIFMSPDGALLAATWSDGSGGVHRSDDGEFAFALPDEVQDIMFAPDMGHLLARASGTIHLHDVATGEIVARREGALSNLRSFLADGKTFSLVRSAIKGVEMFDRETGAFVGAYLNHPTGWSRIATSPDGAWRVTTSGEGVLRVWDAAAAAGPISPASAPPGPGADGVLASAAGGAKIVRDGDLGAAFEASGGDRSALSGHRGAVRAAAFAETAGVFATGGGDGRIIVRSLDDQAVLRVIDADCGAVDHLFFARDDAALIATCAEGETLFLDVARGRRLLMLPTGAAEAAALETDGGALILQTESGPIRWALRP